MAADVGLGAAGIVGIGFEALASPGTPLTAANLDKFFPIISETLNFEQAISKRRVIQGSVDPTGSVLGDGIVTGDITMEVLHDVAPYFAYASRAEVTKGANSTNGSNFDYTIVGSHVACAPYTLTIYVERNGQVFIYGGCTVTNQSYTITDGYWTVTYSIMGQTEATGTAASSPTITSSEPYPMGSHTIDLENTTDGSIAGADFLDQLTFSVNDNASAQYRLEGGTGPTFISYGERTTMASGTIDFEDRDFYDDYRGAVDESFAHTVSNGANLDSAPAVGTNGFIYEIPTAVIETHAVNLSGTSDLVRASVEWGGDLDSGINSSYRIQCINTTEDITVPT